MTDKHIFYEFDGDQYKIPADKQQDFERMAPTAKVMLTFDGENYGIPLSELNTFVSKAGMDNVTYSSFDDKKKYSPDNSTDKIFSFSKPVDNSEDAALPASEMNAEAVAAPAFEAQAPSQEEPVESVDAGESKKPNWIESIYKGLGSSLAGYGMDALAVLSSNNTYLDPLSGQTYKDPITGQIKYVGTMKRTPDYDTAMKEQTDPMIQESIRLMKKSDELSKEADPTGGEKGFVDLILEGKVGDFAQKALATTAQSLPTTLAAKHPVSMIVNTIALAGRNYAKETLENPDIPKWKRGVWALGSAAFEQAVETFVDPFEVGGAAKELTEDVAKEVLEKGAKEAVETISKRIVNALKKPAKLAKSLGKSSSGEGIEEVVTSFGNDVIGEALDLIDGDTDYGIRSQWDEMKEQNPDANLGDFAKNKAKEYLDSFIGGAASGGIMSGSTMAAVETAAAIENQRAKNMLEESRSAGYMMDYGDMYDANDLVVEAQATAADAFTNENGEQTISSEFINALSADDAFMLSRQENIPQNQRAALESYANAKAVQEGLNKHLDDRLAENIDTHTSRINTVESNGNVIIGMHNNKPVYVVDGVVNNGNVTLSNGESGPIIVVDPATGESSVVRTEEVTGAGSIKAEDYTNNVVGMLRSEDELRRSVGMSTMGPIAKMKAVTPLVGKKVLINSEKGLAEVEVQQVLPKTGEVLVKGKKGDLDGQSIVRMPAASFYDMISRDEDGNPMFAEGAPEPEAQPVAEPTPQPAATVAEAPEVEDYRGQEMTIILNGVPVNVEVMSQDNVSGRITYEYVDENGNARLGNSSIAEFQSALEQAKTPAPAPEEEPVVETAEPEVAEEPAVEEQAPTDWDALFEQDKDAYLAELQKQYGDKTLEILNEEVAAAVSELEALGKAKTSSQNERLANRAKKAKLQEKIYTLNAMIARISPLPEIEPDTDEYAEVPPLPEVEPEVDEAEDEAPAAPVQAENPLEEVKKKEDRLKEIIARSDISPEQKHDLAMQIGKEIGDFFDTIEEYNAFEENATDFGQYNAVVRQGVERSFAERNNGTNDGDSSEKSVPLDEKPKGGSDEEAGNGDGGDLRQGDNTGSGRTTDEGAEESGETTAEVGGSEADQGEEIEDRYPARHGDVTAEELKKSFGFKFVAPNLATSTLNSIYDFMMEMSRTLGISPTSIGNGGTLSINPLEEENKSLARYDSRAFGDGTIYHSSLKFKNANLSSIAHEWFHALDHALSFYKTGKGLQSAANVSAKNFTGRKEAIDAIKAVQTAINKSGHKERLERELWSNSSYLKYSKRKDELMARAFDEYIRHKFAEAGIDVGGFAERKTNDPTPEEMKGIIPAFDNLFKVLKEKEGRISGTSVLYKIRQELDKNTAVKNELGNMVAGWIKNGGNFVVMDSASMQKALEEYGLSQDAKKPKRSIYNSDLTRDEKKKIKEYILSLPKDINFDRPLMVKFDGYAYIFNTSRRFFNDNTTKRPKGDGFEILHKKELASLGELETRLLDATYGENSGDINEVLQILGLDKGRSSDSPSVASDAGTEGRYGRVDEAEYREQSTADGSNTGSLRDTGNVQKLETTDGIIYGFVKDGVIYLDPSLIDPNTSIHEYTHLWDNALMQLNPALWEKGKALMKQTPIWDEVINDPYYEDIKNDEDLVASEVHSRLVGTKGAEKLNQLEKEAREKGLTKGAKEISILGKLRKWLDEATNWLKDAFASVWSKEEIDAVTLSDFLNMPLRDLANFSKVPAEGLIENADGEVVADSKGKGKIQFSISTWENGGRDYLVDWLNNDRVLEADEKADIIARMDEFYANAQKYTDIYVPFGTWSDAAVKYDENGSPLMSVIKANGDYAMNLDFSLVCKKRRPLNKLIRTLINRNAFGTYDLREREIAEINWILQEHGFEVACALCFVDAKRYRVTGVADVFAELYNKFVKALAPEGAQIAHFNYSSNPNVENVENGIDTMPDDQLNWKKFDELEKKYKPTSVEGKVAKFLRENPSQRRLVDSTDFVDSNGFEAVKENNHALLSLYNSKKGTGGPKASFGDVQYLNDILKKDKAFDVEKAYNVGGVRLQSFSDFVPHMYFDYMQLFAELAAKRLPAHAYTKEVLFAKIFGLSGIKINMSLVPAVVEGGVAAGLDADGNYSWADAIKDADGNVIQQAQSFPFDEAMAIQNAEGYSKNCGVIAVGISDEHIEKMLDDPNIPYIIPYHKSSLNAIVARMTNIDKYKDYTNFQNTRKANGTKLDKGAADFNFNAYLRENAGATPRQAAQAYLDWCRENNYKPKFSQFAYHANYYKLLADFNTMDARTGEYAPQGAVTMTFPTEQNQFGNVETLIKHGLKEDAELDERMNNEIDGIADEVIERLEEIKKEPKLSEKKQKEHMAKLADKRAASISAKSSISLQSNENVEEHEADSGILNNSGRLYSSNGEGVSWDDYANFNPINERDGESDRQRNIRETQFFETFERLDSNERIAFYTFVREFFNNPSGALKERSNEFIRELRKNGNNRLADLVDDFVNDELKYREGISAQAVARHNLLASVPYGIGAIEHMFNAFNTDEYNGMLFDRALSLAKRFGVTVSFVTRDENGDFFGVLGSYNTGTNSISIDANLLVSGNEVELCHTILHELIHSVVARAISIASGKAFDKNNQPIDKSLLPKDVLDGIQTLTEVYDAIKNDDAFKNEYGYKNLDEMISEISNPKFRTLLKAKSVWRKFIDGILHILGIKDKKAEQSNALTEIESALDKVLSSIERGDLDNEYARFAGSLADGYTIDDLNNIEDSQIKSLLTHNLLFRTGVDPDIVARESAAAAYDKAVNSNWQEFQRQFQDAYQPVRNAIEAIQQETGNIPIEDYENYLLIQNQSSSRSRVEIDNFTRKYYSPIIKQVNAVIDEVMKLNGMDVKNPEQRAEVYKELKTYLIAKHGLERNKYYQSTNTRKLTPYEKKKESEEAKKAYDEKVDAINAEANLSDAERELKLRDALDEYNAALEEISTRQVPDLRDYSGLTSLFGMKPKKFKEAEAEAKKLVDDFEKKLGRVDDADGHLVTQAEIIDSLWGKINAATTYTLRHSYESGLLSRQQFEAIRDMFSFYIPLRGFDETTAEDVYAYARFEGNRFNPAVQTAKGRTSIADDPIAIIMNMAESEIAQGNKNRAKQALYTFLLNRAADIDKQNSLMQIESVWYVKGTDASGNEVWTIAAPDHDAGETLEEFEDKMISLEAEEKAMKSKKGKVDVGMRFQKTMDRNAHYIYLKVNGVEKAIYVNGDPKAADAVNGKYAPQPSKTAQAVKGAMRFVSSMFTNYSVEFTVRNFIRDFFYSRINLQTKESDPEYRNRFNKNYWRNNPIKVVSMLVAYRNGKYDNVGLTEDQAAFVEFMNNGGETGYTIINSVEAHKKDLERAIARMQKGIVKGGVKDTAAFKCTLGAIELMNEASEIATRFAAFKTSRDMGREIHRSISDAKEITVNFNTKGAQSGSGWMGMLARYLGTFKYFFNASVQGVQNIGAMAQKNKGRFGMVVGSMVSFGALMPIINGFALAILGADDEDDYWNIPEYDRQNNLCFAFGNGRYAKLPLPIGFREMYGIGDMAAAAMAGKLVRNPMQHGIDIANKIASIALPINPLEGSVNGLSIVESGFDMLIPDLAQFFLQNRTNKDFKGAPIQKEYTYNEDDPQWTKAFSGNPAWITGLSKWCNENIVIDGVGVDWSPEKFDNTLSNIFGGTYAIVKKSGRLVSSILNKDFSVSKIPVVGVFIGSSDENDFTNSAYWDMEEVYGKRLPLIKRTAEKFGYTLEDVFQGVEDGEPRVGEHHPAMNKIYNRDNFDFMQEWYLGHKGDGEKDEYGEVILGLDQIKNKKKNLENKIKKNGGEATQEQQEELARLDALFETTRRDLVNDLLELD